MNLGGFHKFLKKGSLILVACDGSEHRFGEGSPSVTWRIRAPSTFAKILRNPQRNLGETYVAGESERGRVVPELREYRIRTIRELIVKPYRLIYGTTGNRVSVLALVDGRRDLQDVLMDRFLR